MEMKLSGDCSVELNQAVRFKLSRGRPAVAPHPGLRFITVTLYTLPFLS
jgi:hypothetical protein